MGLPSIVLILADNQRPIAEGLDAAGVSINMGWGKEVSPAYVSTVLEKLICDRSRRQQMNRVGGELVDGGGSRYVTDMLH
jgi:spore coat polysaccharide biosynthesis predicted glycosyltransferase SpsG